MNTRERTIETLTFGRPDRIPFDPGGPRESTLRAWRTQGLGPEANWRDVLCETLGIDAPIGVWGPGVGVDFRMIPRFEEKVLDHRGGHYVVQDWKGNVCEIADTFDVTYLRQAKDFVTRRWIRCPVETPDDWEAMTRRYDPDAPGRMGDLAEAADRLVGRDRMCIVGFPGPFWQMREWCGFEGLCLLMAEQPDFVDEMAGFWSDFVATLLEGIFEHVVPDALFISEDMAYKAHAMISPEMTRRFCLPAWRRWSDQARRAGVAIIDMDSDGYVPDLIPLWIEAGINVCDPMEVAAHNDIVACRERWGRQMAYRGGVDKRAIAKAGRAIAEEMRRIEPVIRSGGFIPGCDHGVPADVSWPAFVEYTEILARMTGWK
jgi:uroporphyrinogen decarboxylase